MFVKYIYTFKYRVVAHGILMTLAVIGSLAVISKIIDEKKPKIEELESTSVKAHFVIGVIILSWICLQLIVGVISNIVLKVPTANPKIIVFLRKSHRISGYVLMLLCKANVILGWVMEDIVVAIGVVCAEIGLVMILNVVYKITTVKPITS